MAVAQTGAIYKALTFAGTSSRNYGVYITGEGVYNAPEREVEMIPIPGRNGAFALDKGRFENITVTYPAGIYADTEADFAQAVSDFRNFLCSKKGYCRLEDDYNTSEYRMAIYKSGLEVTPAMLRAGEFSITFDCKPQRWLTSGETKVSVSNNGSVTNPTLFNAGPLLECKGYGNINIGGGTISIANVPIGNILLSNSETFVITNAVQTVVHTPAVIGTVTIDVSNLNTGDDIYLDTSYLTQNVSYKLGHVIDSTSVSNTTGEPWSTDTAITSTTTAYWTTTIAPQTFKKGTSATKTYEYLQYIGYDSSSSISGYNTIEIQYDGNQTITFLSSTHKNGTYVIWELIGVLGQVNGYSTVTSSNTFNIDLDLGEAYFISNNVYSSANYAVSIPAKLPTLAPGINTITYDNTITNFKVTPRWWKV